MKTRSMSGSEWRRGFSNSFSWRRVIEVIMMSATRVARLYEIVMDAGRIGASKIITSPVKLLPRTWAGMPKMSFRKSRDSYYD
ncbi:hypothetical protein BMR06_07130 [Methylococcaceae bacterium HT5]|nr:hypothetical protein BMR06_07130 [Methylococcaceae bacterium HT5]